MHTGTQTVYYRGTRVQNSGFIQRKRAAPLACIDHKSSAVVTTTALNCLGICDQCRLVHRVISRRHTVGFKRVWMRGVSEEHPAPFCSFVALVCSQPV